MSNLQTKTEQLVKTTEIIRNTLNALDFPDQPFSPPRVVPYPSSIFMGGPPDPPSKATPKTPDNSTSKLTSSLERENRRLASSLEATKTTEAALLGRIEALEMQQHQTDNASKTRLVQQAPAESVNANFLRHRISQQELEISSLKAQLEEKIQLEVGSHVNSERLAALQQSLSEVRKRFGRQSLEYKSVLDQNEILRVENRRLVDSEHMLRQSLMALSPADFKKRGRDHHSNMESTLTTIITENSTAIGNANVESQVDVNVRRGLLELVNEELLKLKQLKEKGSKHNAITPHSNLFPTYQIDIVIATLRSLLPLLNQDNINSMIMGIIQSIVHCNLGCSAAAISLAEESRLIESRIENIGQESIYLRKETEKTISEIYQKYESELQKVKDERLVSSTNNAMLSKQIQELQEEASISSNEKGARSVAVGESREVGKDAAIQNDVKTTSIQTNAQLESLKSAHTKLKSHCEAQERLIDEWKRENGKLRTIQEERSKIPNESNRLMDLRAMLEKAENEVEDERLQNMKAVELIKVLKEQVLRVKQATHGDFDNEHYAADVDDKNDAAEIQVLIGLLQDNQHTSDKFKELNQLIEKQSKACEQLRSQLVKATSEKKKSAQQKAADAAQYHALSDEHQNARIEASACKELYHESERILADYTRQWKDCWLLATQNGMFEQPAAISSTLPFAADEKQQQQHPYTFSKLYAFQISHYTSAQHTTCHVRSQLSDATLLSQRHIEQLEAMAENLRVKSEAEVELRFELNRWMDRANEYEKGIEKIAEEKRGVECKMKRIVSGFKLIVNK